MTIQPRTLQGFRDFLPAAMIAREQLMAAARRVYRSYGFNPIDTPALEYLEILQGKGGAEVDRQLYQFEDQGGRRVGMRFDLTVPLARFAAQHVHDLGMPFKRYHIATVWRGERPQRGRFREFMQCDFDTIGTLSVVSDIETVLVIHDLMQAVGIERFVIRVNHRQVLNGWLQKLDLADKSTMVLRALDKLPKVGPQGVAEEMTATAGATPSQAREVLALADVTGESDEVLSRLDRMLTGSEIGQAGVTRLRELLAGAHAAGVAPQRLALDVAIARGLDYYTGTIVETFLEELTQIGSVCSGGRYDNLAEVYTRQPLPGIGASLGLDRLLAALEQLDRIPRIRTAAQILLVYFDPERRNDYLRIATHMRSAGFRVELYPEPKKLAQQLKYASAKGFRVAVIAGTDEFAAGTCQVKDLERRTSEEVPLGHDAEHLLATLTRILQSD